MSTGTATGLWSGLRILDLSLNAVGQCASSAFGDLGADVIAVSRPGYGRARGFTRRLAVGRSKRSIEIDLKNPRGLAVMLSLLRVADVLIEGFRPGVAERLGIGYAAVTEVRPDIIYCSVSGYGQSGPYHSLPGHDLNYMGVAGAVGRDEDGQPQLPTNNWADRCATLNAQFAIASALSARAADKTSRHIDIAITDSVITLPASQSHDHPDIQRILNGGPPGSETPPNPFLRGEHPSYGMFSCADEMVLSLCCIEPWFWEAFCEGMGRTDWRIGHRATGQEARRIRSEMERAFRSRSRADWLRALGDMGVPVAPVNFDDEVLEDPHLHHREALVAQQIGGRSMQQIAAPYRFDGTQTTVSRATCLAGEDSTDLLIEHGLSHHEIKVLIDEGAIGSETRLPPPTAGGGTHGAN